MLGSTSGSLCLTHRPSLAHYLRTFKLRNSQRLQQGLAILQQRQQQALASQQSSMPPTLKKAISAEQWEQKLSAVKVTKEDMNRLVMNFLVTEVSDVLMCRTCPVAYDGCCISHRCLDGTNLRLTCSSIISCASLA